LRRVTREGTYLRVCSPRWDDPSDTTYSKLHGGRWNPPGEFGALYLNADIGCARANAERHVHDLFGEGISIFDLLPDVQPDLQEYAITSTRFVDAANEAGIRELALPKRFPDVTQKVCQSIARTAYASGESGIAAKSAAHPSSEELAIFDMFVKRLAKKRRRLAFGDWYRTR